MAKQDKNNMPEWDDGKYGTGRMQPPKNHNGVIAVLLILVIFLSGVVTMLSIMNIRLFHRLVRREREDSSITFVSEAPDHQPAGYEERMQTVAEIPVLGIRGDEVTVFYQSYYDLPAGIYVEVLIPGGPAESAGIRAGDILTTLNGVPISGLSELEAVLMGAGETVSITVYRPASKTELEITVSPADGPEDNIKH